MNFLRIRCHLIPAGGQDGQDGQEPNAKCFATLCVSLKTWETKWNMWNPRSTCHILVSYTHPSPDFQQMPAALFIEVLLPDSQTNSRILEFSGGHQPLGTIKDSPGWSITVCTSWLEKRRKTPLWGWESQRFKGSSMKSMLQRNQCLSNLLITPELDYSHPTQIYSLETCERPLWATESDG